MNPTKKEIDPNHNNITTSSSSRQWSSFKNPRIVRVSRNFGGKDRHSKVSTVRGLRDRRIRLSIPTAIQLYDLQDRLGLSQPSKVVDWLINVTQDDIDKLPPLPNFAQFHQTLSTSDAKHLGGDVENNNQNEAFGGSSSSFVAQNFFPLSNQFSMPNMPYNSSYFQFDPPSLSLSQFRGGYNSNSFSTQTDHQEQSQNNYSQLYLCPSTNTIIPSINNIPHFPSYYENEHLIRQNMAATLHLMSSQGNGSGKLQDGDSRRN